MPLMVEILETQSSLHKIISLMYHRVDDTDTDPWNICVSPKHFEEQIHFLKKNFTVISSEDLVNQVRRSNITNNKICLTFDDGYADNYTNAKPILEKYNCSATFFIPTAFTDQTEFFWWDELEIILLHSKKLPHHLLLNIAGKNYNYKLDENELTHQQWQQHANWRYYEEPPTDRCGMFLNIWNKLRPLPFQEINKQIAAIRKWACTDGNINAQRLPMNEQQLHELSKNKLFILGMHTHTHVDLEGKEKQLQHDELLQCKKILGNKYGIENICLAYPYGKFDNNTIKVINELKIAACFTTKGIGIDVNTDLTKLGRYQVDNWNIATFKDYLNKWTK